MLMNSSEYLSIVDSIKREITDAQYRAAVHVNADLLLLYYDIGCIINEHKSWGNKFIDNLASDIHMAFPESKGYSVRNLKYMSKFAARFSDREFVQAALAQITWYHHIALMDKVKMQMSMCGMQKKRQRTVGLAMCWFIRSKAACISVRCWSIRFLTLNVDCHRRKASWLCRL